MMEERKYFRFYSNGEPRVVSEGAMRALNDLHDTKYEFELITPREAEEFLAKE